MPLTRCLEAPKRGDVEMDPTRVMKCLREANWEETLELAGGEFDQIREAYGKKALAVR